MIQHLRNRPLGKGGNFVSGGEKQKIQLARFLYVNKPFFILDEPFTNLDVLNEKYLMEILLKHIKGKSGIIISHKLNVIRLANRCIVLNEGKIIGDGDPSYLIENNKLSRELIKTYLETAKNGGEGLEDLV
nr:ATP-binding cassette domain-containing protein [Anoxybacter fermentans]